MEASGEERRVGQHQARRGPTAAHEVLFQRHNEMGVMVTVCFPHTGGTQLVTITHSLWSRTPPCRPAPGLQPVTCVWVLVRGEMAVALSGPQTMTLGVPLIYN